MSDDPYSINSNGSVPQEAVKAFLSASVRALREMDHQAQGKMDCSTAFLYALEKELLTILQNTANHSLENPAGEALSGMLSMFQELSKRD